MLDLSESEEMADRDITTSVTTPNGPNPCGYPSNYSMDDIIMLMFLVCDNSSFSNDDLKSIQERLVKKHSLESVRQKILDVCGCLKYLVHNRLVDSKKIKIKHREFNQHPNVYKKYIKGKIRMALDVFLALNIYQDDIGQNVPNKKVLYSFFRNCVDNQRSREYIRNKQYICDFIDNRLSRSKRFDESKYIEIDIVESELDKIYNSLRAEMQALLLYFFNFKEEDKKCALCHHKKVERCHEKNRKILFLDTIRDRNLSDTRINMGTFLRYFVLQHKKQPVWMLCKRCHHYWDSTYKKAKNLPVGKSKRGTQKRNLNHTIGSKSPPKKKRKLDQTRGGPDVIVLD